MRRHPDTDTTEKTRALERKNREFRQAIEILCLLEPIGDIPPAEAEANFHADTEAEAVVA